MTNALSNKVSKRNRRLEALRRRVEARKALAATLAQSALFSGPGANLARPTGTLAAGSDAASDAPCAATFLTCKDWDCRTHQFRNAMTRWLGI